MNGADSLMSLFANMPNMADGKSLEQDKDIKVMQYSFRQSQDSMSRFSKELGYGYNMLQSFGSKAMTPMEMSEIDMP